MEHLSVTLDSSLTTIALLLVFIANYLGHIAKSLGEIAKNRKPKDDQS
ncbi:MAG: hypothetical protein M1324_02160 [Patescibacteria group bacterium]|nr:hypothetical protein [Patescibacteria group bacterium]